MSGVPPRRSSKRAKGKLELSPRERDILHLATLGYTDRAISAQLGISKATIGTYWNRLRMKVGPYNRTELVATVLRNDFDLELIQAKTEAQTEAHNPLPEQVDHPTTYTGTHANVLLVDAAGVVTGASPTAAALFGLSLPGIMGCRVETLIPNLTGPLQTELLRSQVKSQLFENDSHNLVLEGRHHHGMTFPVTVILWPISTADGWLVLCGLRNLDLEVADTYHPVGQPEVS